MIAAHRCPNDSPFPYPWGIRQRLAEPYTMYLHRSNRAEVLVAELAKLAATPVGGPLASECIVVQGKGMERWLSMELARHHGVWANPDFPFARAVIDRAFSALLGPSALESWDAEGLRWAVADTLLEMQSTAGFEPIAAYLRDDRHHQKLLQLSLRVAKVLDGYGIYRPELLGEWQDKGGSHWQAKLWQRLTERYSLQHASALEKGFMAALQSGTGSIPGMPARLSLFGISALPPLYLRIFAALHARIDVHLFVLSPSQEYWADIRSQREILREELGPQGIGPDGLQGPNLGNDLLASLGRLHRDFQLLLERDVDYVERSERYPEPSRPDSLLGKVQADVLHLRQRGGVQDRTRIAAGDRSITVHSCHSPIRELEVLRDQIWARLDADESLEPRDIIVMCPDVEGYAPFIDAVFAERRDGQEHLPFHIADRAPRATYALVDAFLRVLELVSGRLPAPAVLDLLATELVRERFEILASDIATIQEWIAESHIRWARDADHREAVGQPRTDLNTWRFGLDRLLLGYASPASNLELFAGSLAYDDIEGSVADLLGRFAEFCASLFAVQEDLQGSCTLTQWQQRLERTLRALLLSNDETAVQHQLLRDCFAALASRAERYGFAEQLSLASIVSLLDESLQDIGTRSNFLSGGITFCQLVPMRSIPHRVVCLVGMNDGAFPRSTQALSFDLVASAPRLGDRAPRDDDRYLFLEALLAARDAFIITYTGQSDQTNQRLPPSVLVGELLDHLDVGFASLELAHAREAIVIHHALQPFSPRYFDKSDDALFSYSRMYCQDAQSLFAAREEGHAAFVAEAIPTSASDSKLVRLDDLLRFYGDPARWFVNQRIGIYLNEDDEGLESREPLELDGLDRWKVGDQLLRCLLTTGDTDKARRALLAGGALPLGTPALMHLDSELPLVQSIVDKALEHQEGGRLASIEIDLHIGETRLVGQLDSLWSQCRQEVSYSRHEGKRELQAWIQHLVLCHQTPVDYPRETVCIGRQQQAASVIRFRPVADAGPILSELLRLYRIGQTLPLALFGRSSRAFARHWQSALRRDSESDAELSLAVAREVYEGGASNKGPAPECTEPYIRLLFAGGDALASDYRPVPDPSIADLDFRTIAMKVFAPLLDHRGTE